MANSLKDRNKIVIGTGLAGAGAGLGNAAWRITRGTDEFGGFGQMRDLYLDSWNRTFGKGDLVGRGAKEVSAAMVGYKPAGLSMTRSAQKASKELFIGPFDFGNDIINRLAFKETVRTTPGIVNRTADIMQEFEAGYSAAAGSLEKVSFMGELAGKHGMTERLNQNLQSLRSIESSLAINQAWPNIAQHTMQNYSDAEIVLAGKRQQLFKGQFLDYAASPMMGTQKKMKGIRAKVAQDAYNKSILQKIQQVEKSTGQKILLEPMLIGKSKIPMYQVKFNVSKKQIDILGKQASSALKGFRMNIPGTFNAPQVGGGFNNVLYSSPMVQTIKGGKLISSAEYGLEQFAEQGGKLIKGKGKYLRDYHLNKILKDIGNLTSKGRHYLGDTSNLTSSALARTALQKQSVYMPWLLNLPRTSDIYESFYDLTAKGQFAPALSPGSAAAGFMQQKGLGTHQIFGSLSNAVRIRPGQMFRDVIDLHPEAIAAIEAQPTFGPGGIFKRRGYLYGTKTGKAFEAQVGYGTRLNLNVLYAPEAVMKEWGAVSEDLIMRHKSDVNNILATETRPLRQYRLGLETPLSGSVAKAMEASVSGEAINIPLKTGEFLGLGATGENITAMNQQGVTQELVGVSQFSGEAGKPGFLQLHIRQRNEFLERTKLFGLKTTTQFRKLEWFNKQADELLYLEKTKDLRRIISNPATSITMKAEATALLQTMEASRNTVEAISSMALLKKDPQQLMNVLWGGMETEAGMMAQTPQTASIAEKFFTGKRGMLKRVSALGSIEAQVGKTVRFAQDIGMSSQQITNFANVLYGMELEGMASRDFLAAQKGFWTKWGSALTEAGIRPDVMDVLGRSYIQRMGTLSPTGVAIADYTWAGGAGKAASFEPRILQGIASRDFGMIGKELGSDILLKDIMSNMNLFPEEREALGTAMSAIEGKLAPEAVRSIEKEALNIGAQGFKPSTLMESLGESGRWIKTPGGELRYIPGAKEWGGMGTYQTSATEEVSKDMRRIVERYAERPTAENLSKLDDTMYSAYRQSIYGVSTTGGTEGLPSKLTGALRGRHQASTYVQVANPKYTMAIDEAALSVKSGNRMFERAIAYAKQQGDQAKIEFLKNRKQRFLEGEKIAMMIGRHPGGSPEALQPMWVARSTTAGTRAHDFIEAPQLERMFNVTNAAGETEQMMLRADRMIGTAFDTDGDKLNIIMATDKKAEKILHRQLTTEQAIERASTRATRQSLLENLAATAHKRKGTISHTDKALQQIAMFRSKADVGLASSISDQIYRSSAKYGTTANKEATQLIAAAVEQSTISLKKAGATEIINPFHAKVVNAFADLQQAPKGSIAASIESYFADYLGVSTLDSVHNMKISPLEGEAAAISMPNFSQAAQEIEENIRRFRQSGGGAELSRFATGKYKGPISKLATLMRQDKLLNMLGESKSFAMRAGTGPQSLFSAGRSAFAEATQKSINIMRRMPGKRSLLFGAAAGSIALLALTARQGGGDRLPDTDQLQSGDMTSQVQLPSPPQNMPKTRVAHEGARGGLRGRVRVHANIAGDISSHKFAQNTNQFLGQPKINYIMQDNRISMTPSALSRRMEEM